MFRRHEPPKPSLRLAVATASNRVATTANAATAAIVVALLVATAALVLVTS